MSRSGVFPPDSTSPQTLAGRAPARNSPAVLVQTRSPSAAIPSGVPETGVVEITVFVRGSMCETVSSMKFTAHTAPSAKATNVTPGPTAIVRVVGCGPGSMRQTVPSSGLAAHTDPSPTAIPAKPRAGTEMV